MPTTDDLADFSTKTIAVYSVGWEFPELTESIQDTSPRIHPSRNKKPVSEKLAPRIYPWGQCFNSLI
jgi:hypothetical protein